MDDNYNVELSKEAKKQMEKLKKSGKQIYLKKVFSFLKEVETNPRFGIGKPKPLSNIEGNTWSRKINDKDRFVYEILENERVIFVTQILGHYEDK